MVDIQFISFYFIENKFISFYFIENKFSSSEWVGTLGLSWDLSYENTWKKCVNFLIFIIITMDSLHELWLQLKNTSWKFWKAVSYMRLFFQMLWSKLEILGLKLNPELSKSKMESFRTCVLLAIGEQERQIQNPQVLSISSKSGDKKSYL